MGTASCHHRGMMHVDPEEASTPEIVDDLRSLIPAERRSFFSELALEFEHIEFLRDSGWAFLTGLIVDQSVHSGLAWRLPLRLAQRAGVRSLSELRSVDQSGIAEMLRTPPALHRYPGSMAKHLATLYGSCAEDLGPDGCALWREPTASQKVHSGLLRLPGIGPKKAALGMLLLNSELDAGISDLRFLPLAIDVHVHRVLSRCLGQFEGSVPTEEMQNIARRASPRCPGMLSTPLWNVGVGYCRPSLPNCSDCPLRYSCRFARRCEASAWPSGRTLSPREQPRGSAVPADGPSEAKLSSCDDQG
jgi:endonuclease III